MKCPDCLLECTIHEEEIDTFSCPSCGLLLYSRSGDSGSPLDAPKPAVEMSAEDLERTSHWQASLDEILPTPEQLPRRLGRYELVELLGEGSFAQVYRAVDGELGRDVALKVPNRSRFSTPELLKRFVDEARTAAKLEHPGIVRVYDIGWLSDDVCFIAMEYCGGGTLDDLIKTGPVPAERAAQIIADAATAIHFAHLKGLVHRDLKPSNMMFGRDGRIRIVDFGLALPEEEQQDKAGEVAGTLPYMSPEQIRGETQHLDGRTDIWSLGVILYQLLTGRRPFAGNRQQLLAEILSREPKPLRQVVQDIPKDLEEVCLRCLAKSVTGRWATAKDVSDALSACAALRGAATARFAVDPESTPHSAPPYRFIAVLLGLLLLVLVVATASFLPMALSPTTPDRNVMRKLAPDWLDQQPLGLQTPLLNQPVEKLRWSRSNANDTLDQILAEQRLNITTYSRALVRLGQTDAKQFRLDAEIYKPSEAGMAGLFWGYQTDPQDPTLNACHAVYLTFLHDPPDPDRYLMTLARLEFQVGARLSLTTRFNVGEFVDTLRESGGRLEIIANHSGRFTVYWNGVELKSFPEAYKQLERDHEKTRRPNGPPFPKIRTSGQFGIVNERGSALIRNAHFTLLEKRQHE